MSRRIFGAIALLAVASGCGARSLPPAQLSAPSQRQAPSLRIVLPDIALTRPIIPQANQPNLLSGATRSVSITVGSGAPHSFRLVSPGPCEKYNPPRFGAVLHCTIRVAAPVGPQRLRLTTFSTRDGSGAPLARASGVSTGGGNAFVPTFVAIATRLKVGLSATQVWRNTPANVIVTVYGVDAAGATIPSSAVTGPGGRLLTNIRIRGSGAYWRPHLVYNGTFPAFSGRPFGSAIFKYDGERPGSEYFDVFEASGGVPSATASVKIIPIPPIVAVPQILVQTQTGIEGFSLTASGDASPIFTLPVSPSKSKQLVAADDLGNFWMLPDDVDGPPFPSLVRYNARGSQVGAIAPRSPSEQPVEIGGAGLDARGNVYTIDAPPGIYQEDCSLSSVDPAIVHEFAAGTYGARRLGSIPVGTQCTVTGIAIDGKGNVYLGKTYSRDFEGAVLEYGEGASGQWTVVRTLDQSSSSDYRNYVGPFVVDRSDDLLEVNRGLLPGHGILRYPPSGNVPTALLSEYNITDLAIDHSDSIYAVVEIGTPPSYNAEIAVFPPGATAPSRVIAGPHTGLNTAGAIAVAP